MFWHLWKQGKHSKSQIYHVILVLDLFDLLFAQEISDKINDQLGVVHKLRNRGVGGGVLQNDYSIT